jgi:neutral ceramidase
MKTKILILLFLIYASISIAQSNSSASLQVGAAKVDITPEISELPKGFLGIYDKIHSRAIVVSDGKKTVALITLDVGAVPNEMAKSLLEKIATQTGIPTTNIMITATHTHSVPFRIGGDAFEAKIVNSVKQAKEKLQPAKIGYGEGVSYINVNRNIIDPKTRRWWEGPNYDGPSDKTVAVVSFESLDGKPIAVYYNYAMHAVTLGMLDMVSSDAPGATSKYIEDTFDDKIVAVWSTGACGDQNPLYYQQTYDLREIRINEYASRGIDISNKMPPGGQGLDRTNSQVAKLMQQQKQMVASMGQFLGEEVMHVMRAIERKESKATIYANQKIITCPGRKRLDEGRAGYAGTYEDADSVDIKLGLISINDIAISSVGGEVFNPISTRLKKESPFAHTMMATLTNGYSKSGYIPNDAAFGNYTFEVVSSRLKPGFAESAIVNGILDLMYESKHFQK